jgi:hypothetical protein
MQTLHSALYGVILTQQGVLSEDDHTISTSIMNKIFEGRYNAFYTIIESLTTEEFKYLMICLQERIGEYTNKECLTRSETELLYSYRTCQEFCLITRSE